MWRVFGRAATCAATTRHEVDRGRFGNAPTDSLDKTPRAVKSQTRIPRYAKTGVQCSDVHRSTVDLAGLAPRSASPAGRPASAARCLVLDAATAGCLAPPHLSRPGWTMEGRGQ